MSGATLAERCDFLMQEMYPDGFYGELAQQLVEPGRELRDMQDVVQVLNLKQPDQASEPRWRLLADADKQRKQVASENGEEIMNRAWRIGTVATETLPQATLAQIAPERAVFIGEGGARAQGFVRPGILEAAIAITHPDSQVVYQLGVGRKIDPIYKGEPNDEHVKIRGFAPDFASEGQQTEHGNNIALAKQDGFEVGSWNETVLPSGLAVVTSLIKANRPVRECVMPTVYGEKNFTAGLTAMHSAVDLTERQPVVATNGQYKLKDEIMLEQWRLGHNIAEFGGEPVVLGDQTGWRTRFNGQDVITGDRPPLTHLNEAVVAARLLLAA